MIKKAVCISLAVLMLLGMVGCGKTPDDQPVSSVPEESHVTQYVADEAINRFIVAFQEQNRYVMAGRTQNRDGSVTAEIDLCRITLKSTKFGLHVALDGGDTIKAQDRMLDIFAVIAMAVDPGCSQGLAKKSIEYLKGCTKDSGNYRVSNYVKVLNYVPLTQTETVKVNCRMEFLIMHYLPEEE